MVFVRKAYDISRKEVFFVRPNLKLKDIAEKMHMNNIGSVVVKEEDTAVGVITVNDILRQVSKKKNIDELYAKDIMSSPVVTTNKDTSVEDLIDIFHNNKVSRLILLDDKEKIVGVVRDVAVYKCMNFHKYNNEAKKRFSPDYSRPLY